VWASVLGSPIAHSLSPVLHRAAYAQLGLTGWSYDARECTSEQLADVLGEARADPAFGGFSLTMPLKLTAMPLVDDLEPLAKRVGAVNTVVPQDGRLFAANTDVAGLVAALIETGVTAIERPVVLGAGGSAQAAVAALAALGAPSVRVAARNEKRAQVLTDVARASGIELAIVGWNRAATREADLIISAVPASAGDALAPWIQAWPAPAALFDLVYAPWPTALAAAAQRAGVAVLGGLDLLVHQAVGQVALMTGRQIDVAVLRAAGEHALDGRPPRSLP
jgi:shikimate dehydrogenase